MKQRQPIFLALMRAAGILLSAAILLVSAPAPVYAQQGACWSSCRAESQQCKRRADELSDAQREKIFTDCLRAEMECVNRKCHGD